MRFVVQQLRLAPMKVRPFSGRHRKPLQVMPKKSRSASRADPAEMPWGTNEYVGVRLRHARMTLRLRLRDLAAKAGCSESMLSKIENGRAAPSLNTLYRIVEALGLTVGQLFASGADLNGLVSRKGQRPVVKFDPLRRGPGSTLERLIPYDRSRLLQGSIHHIAPGGGSEGSYQARRRGSCLHLEWPDQLHRR